MNITLRYRHPTQTHCDVVVLIDDVVTGTLVLRQGDLMTFEHILIHGMLVNGDTFLSMGNPDPDPEEPRA